MDPRLGLGILTYATAAALISPSISSLVLLLVFALLLLVLEGKPRYRQIFITLVLLTGFVLLSNLIFDFMTLDELAKLIIRLWLMNILFSWFFSSVTPEELTMSLVWLKVPHSWAWTLSAAYRYIFLFQKETKELRDAQLVRGIPLDGNIVQRLRYLPSVVIPLLHRTRKRSNQLAEALMSKGWTNSAKLSFHQPLEFRRSRNVVWATLTMISLGILVLNS